MSDSCSQLPGRVQLMCKTCGGPFWVYRYRAHKASFCSRKCPGRAPVTRSCLACGAPFQADRFRIGRGEGLYCSRICNGVGISERARRPGVQVARFMSHVNTDGPVLREDLGQCHVWTGSRTKFGYGEVRFQRRTRLAHRVAWFIEYGKWPEPCALHKCDGGVVGCVRVDHLFEGTPADNTADMHAKGRWRSNPPRGEKSGRAKLTDAQAVEIVARLRAGEIVAHITKDFPVTRGVVDRIKKGRSWLHITGGSLNPNGSLNG